MANMLQDLNDYKAFHSYVNSGEKSNFGNNWYVSFFNADGDQLFTLRFDDELLADKALSTIVHNAKLIINV